MSVDPSQVAANTGGGAAAIDALITAELTALAADAQALQTQLAIGETVTATVLPSNGLTDLISIEGYRVAASLPPNLSPGDQITVRVASYTDTNQVVLQIVAPGETPPSTPAPGTTGTPAPPAGLGATASAASPTTAPAAPPASAGPGLAPPTAVFVAASVRPYAPVPPPIVGGGYEPTTPSEPIPGAAGTSLPPPAPLGGIEARLAAARAAAVSVTSPGVAGARLPAPTTPSAVPAPPPAAPPSTGASTAALPRTAAASAAAVPTVPFAAAGAPSNAGTTLGRAFVVPPQIAPRFGAPIPPAPVSGGQAAPAPASAASAATEPASTGAASAPAAPPATPATYTDPVNLVRALRLPVTPTNLAAARLALEAPQRLPAALATLESALPQTDDPRVATYRAIVGFIGKIDPQSPQLATQLEAYVEHVVAGTEPVVAQLAAAHAANDAANLVRVPPPPAGAPAAPPAGETGGAPAAASAAAEPVPVAAAAAALASEPAPTLPALALAQIVERTARLAASLKETLFSLVGESPATASEIVAPAATSALTAVTAVQLTAAQAALATPGAVTLAIPLFVGGGYTQAQVTVDRDAPEAPRVPLDGDNFHIAFVLDTKHLGTVAIDLRTVGREYALSVKTENLRTAERFGDELSRLTDRLGSLRYRAASVEAVVATPGADATSAIRRAAPESNDDGNWTARA